jgi:glycosyltransferase involved in cell wall biosynthesis
MSDLELTATSDVECRSWRGLYDPAMQGDSAPPRVLIYSTLVGRPWGGSEKYWYDAVSSDAVVHGVDVRILISRSPVAEQRALALSRLGHTVVWRTPVELPLRRRLARAALRRLGMVPADLDQKQWRRRLDEHQPDLLVFAISSTVWYADLVRPAALARARGVPYWIIVQHSSEHFFPSDDEETDRFRAVFAGARRVIFVAQRNRLSVERIMGEPMANAWMGTNSLSREFLRRAAALLPAEGRGPPEVPRLLNLARFEPDVKGQHLLLKALAGAEWKQREWRLTLTGGGRLTATLGRLVRYFGLGDRVDVVDYRDNVLSVIAEADLAVMPSLSEGTPYALLESMAAGRPAVGTPVGGIPEVIQDGRTGWLAVAPEVGPISEALERAWTDMPEWPAFGRRAAELVEGEYCADETLQQLGAALRQDVGRWGGAG